MIVRSGRRRRFSIKMIKVSHDDVVLVGGKGFIIIYIISRWTATWNVQYNCMHNARVYEKVSIAVGGNEPIVIVIAVVVIETDYYVFFFFKIRFKSYKRYKL